MAVGSILAERFGKEGKVLDRAWNVQVAREGNGLTSVERLQLRKFLAIAVETACNLAQDVCAFGSGRLPPDPALVYRLGCSDSCSSMLVIGAGEGSNFLSRSRSKEAYRRK